MTVTAACQTAPPAPVPARQWTTEARADLFGLPSNHLSARARQVHRQNHPQNHPLDAVRFSTLPSTGTGDGSEGRGYCPQAGRRREMQGKAPLDPFEFARTVAAARIRVPGSTVRLPAGRQEISDELLALSCPAGADSILHGDKLLRAGNPEADRDEPSDARSGRKAG